MLRPSCGYCVYRELGKEACEPLQAEADKVLASVLGGDELHAIGEYEAAGNRELGMNRRKGGSNPQHDAGNNGRGENTTEDVALTKRNRPRSEPHRLVS